jgi:hypothetical protein
MDEEYFQQPNAGASTRRDSSNPFKLHL